MDRAFADAEFLRGGADRGPVLYDVKSETLGPLLHVPFQNTTLPASCWSILCGARGGYDGGSDFGEDSAAMEKRVLGNEKINKFFKIYYARSSQR